jgi:hypothetical protein
MSAGIGMPEWPASKSSQTPELQKPLAVSHLGSFPIFSRLLKKYQQ